MAIIDIVKYEQQEGVIVHKFPSCDLRWGTQLVVYPGQVAFFVKGGSVCDKFTDGTYTLRTDNIPLLNKIVTYHLVATLLFRQTFGLLICFSV